MPYQIPDVLPKQGSRQDQFSLLFSMILNGKHYDMGYWDKKTGGELDSDEVKYTPGGTNSYISLGGRTTPGNVTLQRIYDRDHDHIDNRIGRLFEGVGRAQCTVTQTPYNIDGEQTARKIQWKGTLKRVMVPDVDSEATSAALMEVEISTAGGSPDFL